MENKDSDKVNNRNKNISIAIEILGIIRILVFGILRGWLRSAEK